MDTTAPVDSRDKLNVTSRNLTALSESIKSERDYSPTPGERSLLDWLRRATELPGKSTVRMAVLFMDKAMSLGRKWHLSISPREREDAGISRVAAYEAVIALEAAGLVTVRHCRGRSSLVSIVDADPRHERGE